MGYCSPKTPKIPRHSVDSVGFKRRFGGSGRWPSVAFWVQVVALAVPSPFARELAAQRPELNAGPGGGWWHSGFNMFNAI